MRSTSILRTLLLLLTALPALRAYAQEPSTLTSPEHWAPTMVPFAFRYGGTASTDLLGAWQFTAESNANR